MVNASRSSKRTYEPFEQDLNIAESGDAFFPDTRKSNTLRQQILIAVSCFTLTFTGCGVNFAFGVYEELYETLDGPFKNANPGAIGFIGTFAASLMTLGAPLATKMCKQYGPRMVVLLGGALFTISGILASFGTRLWHFQASQGFLQGCAACLIYIPAVTVPPGYFKERRALVMGIITSGTGFGGMMWAPFLRFMISLLGYRQTIRVTAVLAGAIVALSSSMLEKAEKTPDKMSQTSGRGQRAKQKLDLALSQDFVSHALGSSLQAAAYMIPVYYMSSYARTLGYSRASSANIIALSDACNSGGKIVIGHYADQIGSINALILSTLVSAGATFGLSYVSSLNMNGDIHQVLFVVYACVYGITAGAYVSLFPAALMDQFGSVDFGKVSGLLYMIRGIGTLIGTPLGGNLVRSDVRGTVSSSFDRTFLFVGFLLLGATASVAWARSLEL